MTHAYPIVRSIGAAERSRERQRNVQAVKRAVFRHRIDYHWLPDERIEAVLTITLPNGHTFRFTAQADPHEIAAGLAAMHPEVGGFSLGKLWKGIKKTAKAVATSGVFKTAASALAMAAPALGPLAPMALGASAAMKASTALLAAKTHAAKGTPQGKAAAAKLVEYAGAAAKVVDRTALRMPAPKAGARALPPSAAIVDTANVSSQKVYAMLMRPA